MPTKDEIYTAVLLACGPVPNHWVGVPTTEWLRSREQWRSNASQIMGKPVSLGEQDSFENWCINKQHGLDHG